MTEDKARRFLNGYTQGLNAEQKERAVRRMVELGECAWHAAAQVTKKPCWCSNCRPDVRRFS